jgi:hypothetical protein
VLAHRAVSGRGGGHGDFGEIGGSVILELDSRDKGPAGWCATPSDTLAMEPTCKSGDRVLPGVWDVDEC